MNRALNWTGQAVLYACFAIAIAVFTRWPVYHPLGPDMAQIKVSFIHHGQRLAECRPYTEEEKAKMAPNMRKAMKCERERSPVTVEIVLDGKTVIQRSAAPAGLSRDGASTMYQRLDVPAGKHEITVRFNDHIQKDAAYQRTETIDLKPAQVLIVDFNEDKGGIVLQ